MSEKQKETRALTVHDLEVREASEGAFAVRGHAMTWDDPYNVWDFDEQISRDAVPDDIGSEDVFAFWGHNSERPLARTANGTLTLRKDEKGLAVEFPLPASAAYEAEAIRTGLVDKMSVGFIVESETWEERDGESDLRTINRMQLLEVSPVAQPANPNTSIAQRRRQEWREAREAQDTGRAQAEAQARARELKLRQIKDTL